MGEVSPRRFQGKTFHITLSESDLLSGCCDVAFFFPSLRNFIGPLRLNLSKSIKFSPSGPKTKAAAAGRGGGLREIYGPLQKNSWLAQKNCYSQYFKITLSWRQ